MNKQNEVLLAKVIETNLEATLRESDADAKKEAFRMAMTAVDKQVELDKIEATAKTESDKLEFSRAIEELKAYHSEAEAKKDRWVQIGTFIAGVVVVPAIDFVVKNFFVDKVGKLEQFETYTSSPGRGLMNGLFKFDKKK